MKKIKLIVVLLGFLFLSAIIPKNLLQTKADATTNSDYVLVTKLALNTNKTDTKYEIYADSAHYDASTKTLQDGASVKVVYTGPAGAYHIKLSVSNLWSTEFLTATPHQSKTVTLKLSNQINKAVPLDFQINDSQDIYSDQGVISVGPTQSLVTINDGISNWTETPQNTIGQIKTGDNQYLCYTFGNADGTLTSADGGNMKPMLNIFLKDNGKTVATFSNANRGLASSYDYGLMTDRDGTQPHLGDTSLPYNLENFKTYKGTDANGKTVLKAVGSYSVGIQVEMLLRPAADDSTIQQEMYLLNTSDSALTSGGIFFAKDTELDGNDGVPIYAQAKNNGFYMQTDNYKVFMNMKVPDGPQNYVAENYHRSGGYATVDFALDGFNPANFDGVGVEGQNLSEGSVIYSGTDSAYSAKWPWQSFAPNQVYHYRNDIGLIPSGVIVPQAMKSYTNKTSKDGKNHIGDQLTFSLQAHNLGYKSSWSGINVTDQLPAELKIDPATLKLVDNAGKATALPASDYDAATRTISVKFPKALADNESSAVTFEATIGDEANGQTITNSMTAKSSAESASSKVTIPVEKTTYLANLTKQVKNETTGDKTYQAKTDGHVGDILAYQLRYTVDQNSEEALQSGTLKDVLPEGLSLDAKSIKVTNSSNGQVQQPTALDKIQLATVPKGTNVTVDFKATITDKAKLGTSIKNVAQLNGTTSVNQTAIADSSEADVDVKQPLTGTVTFKYLDRATNQALGDKEVTVKGPIGKKISELTTAETSSHQDPNQIRPAFIPDYVAVDYTDQTDLTQATFWQVKDLDPVISDKPQVYTIRYERSGLRFADYPTDFDFGVYNNAPSEATYYLSAKKDAKGQKEPYGVVIEDYFGTKDWRLGLQQAQQFTGTKQVATKTGVEKTTYQLENAQLQFSNAELTKLSSDQPSTAVDNSAVVSDFKLTPGGQAQTLVTYHKKGQYAAGTGDNTKDQTYDNPGYSTWNYHFGDQKTADYSIGLHIPATTKRQNVRYTTKLTWTLTVAP